MGSENWAKSPRVSPWICSLVLAVESMVMWCIKTNCMCQRKSIWCIMSKVILESSIYGSYIHGWDGILHYFGSMVHIMIHQDYFTRYFVIPLLNYILQVKILKFEHENSWSLHIWGIWFISHQILPSPLKKW